MLVITLSDAEWEEH